jgi:uncharacterized protein YjbI with pentapeptide repeats
MRDLRLSSMPILGLLVVIMILIYPQSALAQECPHRDVLSGKKLVKMLGSQQQVLVDCAQVKGEIDLRGLGATRGSFVLTNSIIEGALIAPSTIFKGTVDFTNSTFSGKTNYPNFVDLHGSIFEGDVVWSQAEFGARSENPSGVDFRGVRFRGITDLRGALFNVPVQFQNATFEGRTSFQQTQFQETSDFTGAAFEDSISFVHSIFRDLTNFEGVNVAKDVDFTGARFNAVVIFRTLSVMGHLSIRRAYFEGKVILDMASVGDLQLEENDFVAGVQLSMAEIEADSLEMDLKDIDKIDNDLEKRAALEAVERTARNKGSIAIANDALFRRRVLENNERDQPLQILNRIFNEGVAGYAVRPLRPLFSVLVVVLFGWLVRLAGEFLTRRVDGKGTTLRFNEEKMTRRLDEWLAVSLGALGASLHAALSPKLNISVQPEQRGNLGAHVVATAQLVEWVSQKVLIGLFLIAIANAVPAAKEFISSIFKF